MKLPCAVTRDLLPLYAENMVEQETKTLVEEHLAECADCQNRLEEMKTDTEAPVETVRPLQNLKKEIRKRRWYSAIIAALCVFVVLCTWYCRTNNLDPVPWTEGLIEVKGIEKRPYEQVYGQEDRDNDADQMSIADQSAEPQDATVEVLVLQVDSLVNGYQENSYRDENGELTTLLQVWTSNGKGNPTREYNEMVLFPVPDRLIYDGSGQQKLLWGEPLAGGVEVLPRLALAYYFLFAAGLALVTGIVWVIFRNREKSWISRQIFFAPVSYLIAHFLVKGIQTKTFSMGRDFASIMIISVALYVLISLAWQIWLQYKKTA